MPSTSAIYLEPDQRRYIMTHAQTNLKNSTNSGVSDVAQHVCDSGVSLACCGLQLAAVQQLPACEDELAQKGLTDWAGHCSYPLLEGLDTIFLYSVNILHYLGGKRLALPTSILAKGLAPFSSSTSTCGLLYTSPSNPFSVLSAASPEEGRGITVGSNWLYKESHINLRVGSPVQCCEPEVGGPLIFWMYTDLSIEPLHEVTFIYTYSVHIQCWYMYLQRTFMLWTAACSSSTTPCMWRWVGTKRVDWLSWALFLPVAGRTWHNLSVLCKHITLSWWEKISPAYFNPGEGVGTILQQHLYLWSFIYQSLKPIQCAVSCITRGRKRDHSGEQLTL